MPVRMQPALARMSLSRSSAAQACPAAAARASPAARVAALCLCLCLSLAQFPQSAVVVMHQSWDATKDRSFASGNRETQPFRFVAIDAVSSAVVGSPRVMDANTNGYPGDTPDERDTYWLSSQTSGNEIVIQQSAYANVQNGESVPGFCYANASYFVDASRPLVGVQRSTGAGDVGRTPSTLYGNYVIMGRAHVPASILAYPVSNPTQTFWATSATFVTRYVTLVAPFSFMPGAPTVYWSSVTAAGATHAGGIWSLAIPGTSTFSAGPPTLVLNLSVGYDPWAFAFSGSSSLWVLDAGPQFRTRGNLLLFSKGIGWSFTRSIMVSSQLPVYAMASELVTLNNPLLMPFTARLYLANRHAVYSFTPSTGVVETLWVAPTAVMLTAHSATSSWSGSVTWIRGLAQTLYAVHPFSMQPSPSPSASPAAGFSGVAAARADGSRFATGAVIVLGMLSRGGADLAVNSSLPASATGFSPFIDVVNGPATSYEYSNSAVWLDSRSDLGIQPCLATNGGVFGWPAYFDLPSFNGEPSDALSGSSSGGGSRSLRGVAWIDATNPSFVHTETQLLAGEFSRSPVTSCATVDGSFFYVAGGRPGVVQNFAADGVRLVQNGQIGTLAANISGDSMSGSAPTSLLIFNRTLYGASSRAGLQGIVQLSLAPGSLPANMGPRAQREIRHLALDYVAHPGMTTGGSSRPLPVTVAHAFALRSEGNALLGYVDTAGNEVHDYRRGPDSVQYGSTFPLRWTYARGFVRDSALNPYGPAAPISMAGRVEPSGAFILYCVFAPVGPGLSRIFTLLPDTGVWSLWRSYSTLPGMLSGRSVPGMQVRGIALAPWSYATDAGAAATAVPSLPPLASPSPLAPSFGASVGATAAPSFAVSSGASVAPSAGASRAVTAATSALPNTATSALPSVQTSPTPHAAGATPSAAAATAASTPSAAASNSTASVVPGLASLCAPAAAQAASRAMLDSVASSAASNSSNPSDAASAVLAAMPRCAPLPFALLAYGLNLTALSSNAGAGGAAAGSAAVWTQVRDRYGGNDPTAAAGGGMRCWRPAVNGSALAADYPVAAAAAASLASDSAAPLGSLPGDVCALSCTGWDAVQPTVALTLGPAAAAAALPSNAALSPASVAVGPMAWLCDSDGAWVPARMLMLPTARSSSATSTSSSLPQQQPTAVQFSAAAMTALAALRSASGSSSSSGVVSAGTGFLASIEPLCDSRIANGSALAASVAAAASTGTAAAWEAALASTWARVGFPVRSGFPPLPPPMCLPLAPRPQAAGSVAVCQGVAAVAAVPAPVLPWSLALPFLSAWDAASPDAVQQAADVTSLADAPAGAYAPLLVASVPAALVLGRNTSSGRCVLSADPRIPPALLSAINASISAQAASASHAGDAAAALVLAALPAAPLLAESRATQQSGALSMRLDTAAAFAAVAARLQVLLGAWPGNQFDAARLSVCETDITVHLLVAATGGPSATVQAITASLAASAALIDGTASPVGIPAVPGVFRAVSSPALPLWRGNALQYSTAASSSASTGAASAAPLVYSQCARAVGLVQPPQVTQAAAGAAANSSGSDGSTSSGSTLFAGAIGAWSEALPPANRLSSDTTAKRLVVSELLRPAPFAVTLLDPPLPSEVVTIACSVSTARVPHLAVTPTSFRLSASDFSAASSSSSSSSSSSAPAGVTRVFNVFVRSPTPAFNSSLLDESLPRVAQEALTCTIRGEVSDGSGQQPAYRANSAPIAADVLYLRPAAPLLLDSVVELRLGGGSNVTMLRAAWSAAQPATVPLADVLTTGMGTGAAGSADDAATGTGVADAAAAASFELRDRVARSNPLVVAARAGTLQSRVADLAVATSLSATGTSAIRSDFSFSLLVTGAANVTLVAQAAFASLAFSSSGSGNSIGRRALAAAGAASITRGPFVEGMQVRIGSAPCTVQWISPDGMLARVTTPATADLCPALARALASGQPTGRDCGFQPIAVTLPGAPAAAAIAALATAPLGAPLPASSTGLSVRLTCPPACPGVGSGLVPVPAAATSSDASASLSLGLATTADVAAAAATGSGVPALPIRAAVSASFGGIYYSERCTDTGLYEDPSSGLCGNASDPRSRRCAYGAGDLCQQCPLHATCPGGFRAYPLPGYWSSSVRSTQLLSCPAPTGRCTGYSESSGQVACGVGYRQGSVLCLGCAEGYYQAVDTTCQLCPPTLTVSDIIVPIAKFAGGMLAVATAMFIAVVFATKRNGGTLAGGARRTLQFTLSTFAVLQIFVSVGRAASPGLPPFMRDFIAGISVFVFDFPSIPAACVASPSSRWRGVILQFLLVIVAEVLLAALHVNCRRVCGCNACGAPRLTRAAHASHAAALKLARKSVAASAAGAKKKQKTKGAAAASKAALKDGDSSALAALPPGDGKADARHSGVELTLMSGGDTSLSAVTVTAPASKDGGSEVVGASKASPRKIGGGVGGMNSKQQMEALARQRAADAMAARFGSEAVPSGAAGAHIGAGSSVAGVLDRSKRLLRRLLWTLLFLLFATLTVSTISMLDCVTVTVPLRAYLTYDRDPLQESSSLSSAGISASALSLAIDGCGADPLSPACVGDGATAASSPTVLLDSSISVRVLSSDPFQVCGEGSHRTPAALAVLVLILYVVGFPLASGLAVYCRGMQLVRKSAFGPAWELAAQQEQERQRAFVSAAHSAPHKALRRVVQFLCCTGRRHTGLPSASLHSRTGRLLRCLQLDCLAFILEGRHSRAATSGGTGDPDLQSASNPMAPHKSRLSVASISRRATHVNPLRPTLALPDSSSADAGAGADADALAGSSPSAAAKAAALGQTLALARLPLPPLLLEQLRQESAAWARRAESKAKTASSTRKPSASSSSLTGHGEASLVCWGEEAKARGLSLAVQPPTDERYRVDFSPADAAAQTALLAGLCLPPGRVITAGEIFDAAPPVVQDAALAPFFSADFRASSWWFKHLDLGLLFVLDVLLVVYRQPSSGGAAARAALTVIALSCMLAYYVAKKPYRPEVSYNAPVRAYSLLLSAFVAGLNFACFQASQAAAAAAAAGARPPNPDESISVLLLSWLTFVAAVGLLATLFVSFWLALLRGAASEQRALQAAVDRRAKERIFVTPKSNVAATLAAPAWHGAADGADGSSSTSESHGWAAAGHDHGHGHGHAAGQGWWQQDASTAAAGEGRHGFDPAGTQSSFSESWAHAGTQSGAGGHGYDHAWGNAGSGFGAGAALSADGSDGSFAHSNPLARVGTATSAAGLRRGRRGGDGSGDDADGDNWGASANEFAPTAVAASGGGSSGSDASAADPATGSVATGAGGRVAAARAAFAHLSTSGSPSTPVFVPVPEALAMYKRNAGLVR